MSDAGDMVYVLCRRYGVCLVQWMRCMSDAKDMVYV